MTDYSLKHAVRAAAPAVPCRSRSQGGRSSFLGSVLVLLLALVVGVLTSCTEEPPPPSSAPATPDLPTSAAPAPAAGSPTEAPGATPAGEVSPETALPTRPAATSAVTPAAQGGTLNLLLWQAPTILNPHLARGSKDYFASRITYEPLASYDRDGMLVPFLAADIPSLENGGVAEDGTWVIWPLKQGVTWSDGHPFTAEDVLFTYEYITNPENVATSGAQYDMVERVEVLDDYTVKVVFKERNPVWSLPFVGPRGLIIPRHLFAPAGGSGTALQEGGEEAGEPPANPTPVGTGPYRVVAFVPGDIVIYEANPFFREPDRPFFSRVELKSGGDATLAARAVLQTGEVDFAENLQVETQVLDQLQQTATTGHLVTISRPLVEHILINHTDPDRETSEGERSSTQFPHPFFSDRRVRQAFTYAIDRETIANQLYGPNGRPTSNILVEPPIYRSPNTSYEYNLDRAAALLDEAGWVDHDGDGIRDKDGVAMRVLFQTATGSVRQKTQEIVKQSLEVIGVGVELKSIAPATFFDNDPANPDTYSHFYADLQMFTIPYDSPDPGAYMQGWMCDEIPQKANDWSANNIERWCNPAYDALYEQAMHEMDPEQRRQLFIQMNDMLIEEVVLIPLVHRMRVSGVGDSIEGVDLTPWDESVWNIQEWRRR